MAYCYTFPPQLAIGTEKHSIPSVKSKPVTGALVVWWVNTSESALSIGFLQICYGSENCGQGRSNAKAGQIT